MSQVLCCKLKDFKDEYQIRICLTVLLSSGVTLGKLIYFSKPQFLHLQD